MKLYNFKNIAVVPTSKDFVDLTLSKTQRKTPTVIHKNYKISRIRSFYTRKVKYTQQTFHDRLSRIIQEFPKVDNIHPFYADLMNILYDKDHYKIALGQLNQARHLIDKIGKEYARLLKFGDSLYRCKLLKNSALGRMVTVMKKQSNNLEYLEEVRQHLARLPAIDPYTRTIIVCGFPNVGKSSFVNKITRADVEVQPYAFTTKSLYVGHTDYKYLRYQVIDTPGILDHPLEERNIIEMQAVTALAHLRAAIIYFVDISEQCGHTIEEQISLYDSIRPLFTNKPLMVVCNKIDIIRLDEVSDQKRAALKAMFQENGVNVFTMSTKSEEGVAYLKEQACENLLAFRVENKINKLDGVLNKLTVSLPKQKHSNRVSSAVKRKQGEKFTGLKKKLERDIEEELGDDYILDLKKNYDLPEEYKYDAIPEIWEGHNVADFIHEDILKKLENLEKEERLREEGGFYSAPKVEYTTEMLQVKEQAAKIREKKALLKVEARIRKQSIKPTIPRTVRKRDRTVESFCNEMADIGVDLDITDLENLKNTRDRVCSQPPSKRIRFAIINRSRDRSKISRDQCGVRDVATLSKLKKIARKAIAKKVAKKGLKGVADRFIGTMKPKHLFSGKRGIGKAQRR